MARRAITSSGLGDDLLGRFATGGRMRISPRSRGAGTPAGRPVISLMATPPGRSKTRVVPPASRTTRSALEGVPMHRRLTSSFAVATAALLAAALAGSASADSSVATGPNTSTSPYLLPVADGLHLTSLLTVGDGAATNGYLMVGSPDGLGLMAQGSNLVLYMNHELGDDEGIARRHGQTGAFVSRWVIDPATMEVKEGSDWINPGVQFWDYPSGDLRHRGRPVRRRRPPGRHLCAVLLRDPVGRRAVLRRGDAAPAGRARSTSPTRRTATPAACSASRRRATRPRCRASACSSGRTRSPPPTGRRRRSSSATRTGRPTAASFAPTSARSSGAVRRSRRRD